MALQERRRSQIKVHLTIIGVINMCLDQQHEIERLKRERLKFDVENGRLEKENAKLRVMLGEYAKENVRLEKENAKLRKMPEEDVKMDGKTEPKNTDIFGRECRVLTEEDRIYLTLLDKDESIQHGVELTDRLYKCIDTGTYTITTQIRGEQEAIESENLKREDLKYVPPEDDEAMSDDDAELDAI
jgi:hypothetical protein